MPDNDTEIKYIKELITVISDGYKQYGATMTELAEVSEKLKELISKLTNGMKQEIIDKLTDEIKETLQSICVKISESNTTTSKDLDIATNKLNDAINLLAKQTASLESTDFKVLAAFNEVRNEMTAAKKSNEEFERAKKEAREEVKDFIYNVCKWIVAIISALGATAYAYYQLLKLLGY